MLRQLYLREWEVFKRDYLKFFIVITGISLMLSVFFYVFLIANQEVTKMAMEQLMEMFEGLGMTPEMSHTEMFALILMQNLRAALFTVVAGLIPVVVLPLISPVLTSISVSVVLSFVKIQGESVNQIILYTIAPHGIVELTALFLSASIGIFLSLTAVRKIFSSGKNEILLKPAVSQGARSFLLVVTPLIVIAAILESFLTPLLTNRFIL